MAKVYFISDGDYVKIGCTKDLVRNRLRNLQSGNAKELRLLRFVDNIPDIDKYRVEKGIHEYVKQFHYKREWYDVKCMDMIAGLSDTEIICLKEGIMPSGGKDIRRHHSSYKYTIQYILERHKLPDHKSSDNKYHFAIPQIYTGKRKQICGKTIDELKEKISRFLEKVYLDKTSIS